MKTGLTLSPLHHDDIEEKILLNEKAGVPLRQLRDEIIKELLEFQWMKIRAEVQIQNYQEQLAYMNKKLADLDATVAKAEEELRNGAVKNSVQKLEETAAELEKAVAELKEKSSTEKT